jgi:hypothetical protein
MSRSSCWAGAGDHEAGTVVLGSAQPGWRFARRGHRWRPRSVPTLLLGTDPFGRTHERRCLYVRAGSRDGLGSVDYCGWLACLLRRKRPESGSRGRTIFLWLPFSTIVHFAAFSPLVLLFGFQAMGHSVTMFPRMPLVDRAPSRHHTIIHIILVTTEFKSDLKLVQI